MLLCQPPRNLAHLHLGLRQFDAAFQTRDHAQRLVVAVVNALSALRIKAEGQPDLALFGEADEPNPRGQHATHFKRLPVQRQRLADEIRVGAETPLPETVTDDDGARAAGLIFFRPEVTPQHWLHAEHGE